MKFKSFLFLLFVLTSLKLYGQKTEPRDSSSPIDIIYIEKFFNRDLADGNYRDLFGSVHLRQDGTHFWCDTAYLKPKQQLLAYGDVQLNQEDSIRVFADTLRYDGLARKAVLRGQVVLQDTASSIYTPMLLYDLNKKEAEFPRGALIESDSAQLTSKRGWYRAGTGEAYFEDSVRLTHPQYKLMADSLGFNTRTEVARFLGPTTIYNEDKLVYCEAGYFDTKRQEAEFAQNAYYESRDPNKKERAAAQRMIYNGKTGDYYLYGQASFSDEKQMVEADTIIYRAANQDYEFRGNPVFQSKDSTENQRIRAKESYYDRERKLMQFYGAVRVEKDASVLEADSLEYSEERKFGLARGEVVWVDTVQQLRLLCGEAEYRDSLRFLKAYQEPILCMVLDGDSLWLRADTLLTLRQERPVLSPPRDTMADSSKPEDWPVVEDSLPRDTTTRTFLWAYNHVEIYKSNMQAKCDSLAYNEWDSIFALYDNPLLWADSSQLSGDTIYMKLLDNKLERVLLRQNGLIVRSPDQVYFSQIAGRNLEALFAANELYQVWSDAQSRAIYYLLDEQERYLGVNKVESSRMKIGVVNRQVERIHFFEEPKATMYPMKQVVHEDLRVPNFRWEEKIRPKEKFVRQNAGLSHLDLGRD